MNTFIHVKENVHCAHYEGKRLGNPNQCICWAKGPIQELEIARGQEKHFRKALR